MSAQFMQSGPLSSMTSRSPGSVPHSAHVKALRGWMTTRSGGAAALGDTLGLLVRKVGEIQCVRQAFSIVGSFSSEVKRSGRRDLVADT